MKLVKFVAMMIIMTIVCTVAWEAFLAGKVYTCTDGPTGYLTPGDWVHAHDGLPVVVVPKIVPPHDMSDPDTIKQGWSVTGLWSVWVVFLGSSVIVSVLFAWIPWVETLDWLAKRRRENVRAV
ncbi:MAG TPA: hypothetical protein VKS19_08960 [Verrucomicrobiae bacterium]|nr:hypothetical protein [Verrucomicrobiae bacterium]